MSSDPVSGYDVLINSSSELPSHPADNDAFSSAVDDWTCGIAGDTVQLPDHAEVQQQGQYETNHMAQAGSSSSMISTPIAASGQPGNLAPA
jgi:hypothetical protein